MRRDSARSKEICRAVGWDAAERGRDLERWSGPRAGLDVAANRPFDAEVEHWRRIDELAVPGRPYGRVIATMAARFADPCQGLRDLLGGYGLSDRLPIGPDAADQIVASFHKEISTSGTTPSLLRPTLADMERRATDHPLEGETTDFTLDATLAELVGTVQAERSQVLPDFDLAARMLGFDPSSLDRKPEMLIDADASKPFDRLMYALAPDLAAAARIARETPLQQLAAAAAELRPGFDEPRIRKGRTDEDLDYLATLLTPWFLSIAEPMRRLLVSIIRMIKNQ